MKGLAAKDLRGNEPAELNRTLRKLQEDLFKFRLKQTTNQLENVAVIRNARRDIARVNTVLAERGRNGGAVNAAASAGESKTSAETAQTSQPTAVGMSAAKASSKPKSAAKKSTRAAASAAKEK
jgi:large subunit ribosomal protein L29